MDALQLIRKTQAESRERFARLQKQREEQEQERQQFTGTFLGYDADSASGQVAIDGSSEAIPCEVASTGLIKPGQRVMVSLPAGASRGFVFSMPT